MASALESISVNGANYVLRKRIEIKYNRPTLFRGPQMVIERFHSLTPFFNKKEDYIEIVKNLNEILCATYIPIWLWLLVFIGSLGLLTWIVVLMQKKKTLEQGIFLRKYVISINRGLIENIKQKKLLLFEIPFPSKSKVILHACFYEEVLESDSKL